MTDQSANPAPPVVNEATEKVVTTETTAAAVGLDTEAAVTAASVAKSAAVAAADAAAAAAAEAGVEFEVKRAEAIVEVEVKSKTDVNDKIAQGEKPEPEDDSWYGAGPANEEVEIVKDTLGEEVCQLFVKAVKQLNGASDDVSRVLQATGSFVIALKHVPEDKQTTVAFGVISLPYGRSLVRYLELEGSGSTAVVGKIVKALQSAAAGGAVAEDDADGDEEDDDNEAGEGEEDIVGKDGDDEDIESAWTQLEVARVIFKREGQTLREAECRMTLGELLMACDEGKQAGVEFDEASKLFTDGRRKAECLYKKYLALRNGQKEDAMKALEEAVNVYEGAGAAEDVLADMKVELKDMHEAVETEKSEMATKEVSAVEVIAVRPKRKRDIANAEAAVDVGEPEAVVANGASESEANGKKARVD